MWYDSKVLCYTYTHYFTMSYAKTNASSRCGGIRAVKLYPGLNRIGGNVMRFRTALCLATLFLLCFTVAAWSTPAPDRIAPTTLTPPPDTQSLSGRIASIGDAAFSLEITKGQDKKTLEFFVDGDTKVEGKLEVGSQATVEYQARNGKNVAVHVVVAPNAGH